MAMPAMHIIEHGTPLLPSGMLYPRGVAQLYLMAASVMAFGASEWALRLPSVLCGELLIVLAFVIGRRFLQPRWNLAFTAAVAFLPEFIADSQTARMYVFLVTCVAGYIALLFAWERTGRARFLGAAVAVLLLGMQFHTLAVFAAFLTLFPGLLHGDKRQFLQGVIAFAAIVAGFALIDHWVASQYPTTPQLEGVQPPPVGPKAGTAIPWFSPWLLGIAAVAAGWLSWLIVRRLQNARLAVVAGIAIALGLLAQGLFFHHVATLLLLTGLILVQRNGGIAPARLALLAGVSVGLTLVQLYLLHANGVPSLRLALGAMTGWPSVWPFLMIGQYSQGAAVLVAAGIAVALWRLAHRERIPDHVLFVVLGVWMPLLLIGLFAWDIPFRYAAAQSLPLLLGAFAAVQWLFGNLRRAASVNAARQARTAAVLAAVACLLVVNPIALGRAVDPRYGVYPDHKGAAEFIRSQKLGPRDIVVAEDVLQQTYYLGRVDYWLISKQVAAQFVHTVGGEIRDFYTNTRLIGTGDDLERLIERTDRGAIYVVGSGEDQEDGRRHMRGFGIYETLQSPRVQAVYQGRDGLTTVWKVPPPAAMSAARK